MSTFEFVERTNNSSLKASESAILRGHEVAKLTGTLLVLSLPANAPDTSSAHIAHGMAVPPGGSTPSTGASWVETQFDVFHTKLTMHDVIPDAPSAKVSTYHNPPKPHGHPHHPRHGVPMIRRDFVFATTPVELSMVGSSNPPIIQNIVGKIQFDGQTADDLMFKMTWTNQEYASAQARGVLYLRAANRAERDDWIKSITEAMFMAENVSANFADFRRMRVASAVTRDRRASATKSSSQLSVQNSMHSPPPPPNSSFIENGEGGPEGVSVALLKARETYRLQQEHLRKVYGSSIGGGSTSLESSLEGLRKAEGLGETQYSSTIIRSDGSESSIVMDRDSDETSSLAQQENRAQRMRKQRSASIFKAYGEESDDEGEDGDEVSVKANPLYAVGTPPMGMKNRRRSSVTQMKRMSGLGSVAAGDKLPIRRTSSLQSFGLEVPQEVEDEDDVAPMNRTTSNGVRVSQTKVPLTMQQKTLLKLFSTDNRDQAVDDETNNEEMTRVEMTIKNSWLMLHGDHLYIWHGSRKVKTDSFRRFIRVVATFPFVLIFGILNLQETTFFKNHFKGWYTFCIIANLTIYIIPFIIVHLFLKVNTLPMLTTLLTGGYIALYLLPVCCVCFYKIKQLRETNKIVDGTFHYLPKYTLRFTCPNVCNVYGLVMEFVILATYCLPAEVLGGKRKGGTVERLTGIPYEYVFWLVFAASILNAAAFIMHPVLKGRYKYRYAENHAFWQVIHFINGPAYITVVTFLFQALSCDFDAGDEPVLIEQKDIVCFKSPEHRNMAVCAMIGLALYLTQATLVPTLTYKETMFNKQLDVLYVPVYVQGHWILKAIYAAIYVTFYGYSEQLRVILLLLCNVMMLILQVYVQPCSIRSINVMRVASFTSATWAALSSTLYISFAECASFGFLLLVMLSGWVMIFGGAFLYFKKTQKPLEHEVDHTFLELERQAQTGEVQPRVMEPFIAMTMEVEHNIQMLEECKLTVPQLIWLVDYPNVRIQYQSLWALSNLATHEECRHEIFVARSRSVERETGVEVMYRLFTSAQSQPALKMEALAAIINCSVSGEVSKFLVSRMHVLKSLVELLWRQTIYTQFVTMAVGNMAKDRNACKELCELGAVHALMGLVHTPNFGKQKYACMALANIAQKMNEEDAGPLMNEHFVDRIIKLAVTNEVDLHEEIATLLRNLSFYPACATLLRDRGAIVAIAVLRKSMFASVRDSGQIAAQNLMGNSADVNLAQKQAAILDSFEPLEALVTWDTWGSKLDNIFSPVFAAAPQAIGRHVATLIGASRRIMLKGEDSQGRALVFKIVQQPRHGILSNIKSDGSVVYTPEDDFTGDDYFTYVARNNYMESNVAAVAIKIRNNTELQQAAMAVEALLNEKSLDKAIMPGLTLMGEAFTKQFAAAKVKTGVYFLSAKKDVE
ncbi:hypothetical protein TL16_g12954, partial [Triparma laevis f. inornata]